MDQFHVKEGEMMLPERVRIAALAAAVIVITSGAALAQKKYDTGATDTEIKIGKSCPTAATNDGVKLHYLEAGSGSPLVMIPGWSQSAMEFKYQLTGLSDKYHVYALDMRGHGESAKPNHGYRIQRLSADVLWGIISAG
jgi:hypothetical protein